MWSKGICWIDDCRIPFVDEKENTKRTVSGHQKVYGSGEEIYYLLNITKQEDRTKGRFPANILVSDDMLNDGVISKSPSKVKSGGKTFHGHSYDERGAHKLGFNDKGTNSRYYDIDKWFDKILNYE